MIYPSVSIIILNWNGWKDTIECLESLHQINYPNFHIILVDNGSKDESVENIRSFCGGKIPIESKFMKYNSNNKFIIIEYSRLESERNEFRCYEIKQISSKRNLILIQNERNYGFAEGNNIGIQFAIKNINPKFILLLNNDTIVDPNFLTELVSIAERNPELGSIQSLLLKPGGMAIDSLGQEIYPIGAGDIGINHRLDEIRLNENQEIFGACAAAALYPIEVLKRSGLFDENFFIIYEDVDLSWRIRLLGYSSMLAVKSIVYHKRGISGEHNSNIPISIRYHGAKNSILLTIRYTPFIEILRIFLGTPSRIVNPILNCVYLSIQEKKLIECFQEIYISYTLREKNKKNPRLRIIQKQWIKKL